MFRKRWLIPILLLFFATLACNTLFPELPQNTVPDAVRKDGECTDQRFKDAELAAYQAMLQARAAAEDTLKKEISRIEEAYKQNSLTINDQYQTALNQCKDSLCTQVAEKKYNTDIGAQQIYHDDGIYVAQGNAQTAIEQAQVNYNAEVEEARRLYCSPAYKATGQVSDAQFSGVICSLELPFTLDVTTPYVSYKMEFTPSSSASGAYTFQWQKEVTTVTSSGTYTVEGIETDSPRISVSGDSTGTIPIGSDTEGGAVVITLTPLETDDCK